MEILCSQISERLNNRRFTVAGNTHGLSGAGIAPKTALIDERSFFN